MAEEVGLHGDIQEQILARSDVEDLLRCKAVCKSWRSLICDPLFIKTNLMHSRNKDRKNDKTRRIIMSWLPTGTPFFYQTYPPDVRCLILGSSNGLVCLLTMDAKQILVFNPSIRQVRQQHLRLPIVQTINLLCAGFGYDFITDDYKVVLGDYTCFQVLSLKSSVWKVINVGYKFCSKVGVLCNGALHWFMRDHNEKIVIVAFDLSKEEFKEIPQPDDSSYQSAWEPKLGIMNECLCIFTTKKLLRNLFSGNNETIPAKVWVMNNYNVKQSWEMLPADNCEATSHVIHSLSEVESANNTCQSEKSFGQCIWETNSLRYVGISVFVQSLVSPHIIGGNQ